MKNIINETEIIAQRHLSSFGFNEEQVSTLIVQGKKDLHKELVKLEVFLNIDTDSLADINNVLHALKGLFSQLGNYKIAEQLNEIEESDIRQVRIKEISELFFDAKIVF
ncbi:hypothetical protein [Sulfurovum sp.]|uniref:hypothetical protein n=1 Tax=Sulfurovum sp. TaxID=1969726 RepID=UPI002867FCD1|nr:hypothetical protein [Sulfurovum sp.]